MFYADADHPRSITVQLCNPPMGVLGLATNIKPRPVYGMLHKFLHRGSYKEIQALVDQMPGYGEYKIRAFINYLHHWTAWEVTGSPRKLKRLERKYRDFLGEQFQVFGPFA